jgi:hypothetical protein
VSHDAHQESTAYGGDARALRFSLSGGVDLLSVRPVNVSLGAIRIVSVELYEDGLVVRWLAAPPPDQSGVAIDVADDQGTHYVGAGSGSFGNDSVHRGESCFTPAVPSEATQLQISSRGQTTALDISR